MVIEKGKIAFERGPGRSLVYQPAGRRGGHRRGTCTRATTARTVGKPGSDEGWARADSRADTPAEAQSLIDQAKNGADFGDLARQFSKDPSTSEGGDLGYLPLEALSPEVGSAMFALAPGQVTPYPVSGLFGYFILRVEGRQRRATPTFDESRDRLEREIRADAIRNAITSLLKEINFTPGTKPAEPLAQ